MRLLIECSYVFDHPQMKSGIQRVVRNVVQNLGSVESDVEIIPIAFKENTVLKVNYLEPKDAGEYISKARWALEGVRNHYWLYLGRFERYWPFKQSLTMRRVLFVLMKIASLSFVLPLKALEAISMRFFDGHRSEEFKVEPGDVVVLLDSSWHSDFLGQIDDLKSQGVSVVSVVYDLIPITHPQFCDDHLVKVFKGWLSWITKSADGYIAISDTIKDQLRSYMVDEVGEQYVSERWFSSFHLGSDLDEISAGGAVRPKVRSAYDRSSSVYLTVSTIEPRKNHTYQLDAFEQLWANDVDVCWCVIGKVGWKCDEFIDRVRNHPELGRRLFMFNDLTDDELNFAYKNSKALLFTSFVEGFGLPLVEASQRGLPVICSDIPVFREIGGEACAYCDLADINSLIGHIMAFESGSGPSTGLIPHLSWSDSTRKFISCLNEKDFN